MDGTVCLIGFNGRLLSVVIILIMATGDALAGVPSVGQTKNSGAGGLEIVAIGISGQRFTTSVSPIYSVPGVMSRAMPVGELK